MKLLQKIKIKKKMKENCELPFIFFFLKGNCPKVLYCNIC